MKVFALILALALPVLADATKPTPVVGKCQGGLKPSVSCKTCVHCAYCGIDKGCGVNSATCAVCEAAKAKR